MAEVSIRDLRNRGGSVVDRAAAGEEITITRAGVAVARLQPLSSRSIGAEALVARWKHLPRLDSMALRSDIDATLDPRVS